jgi:hypothetical protein
MSFKLEHFETVRHDSTTVRNYGIRMKWKGLESGTIEIEFKKTDESLDHYVSDFEKKNGIQISNSDQVSKININKDQNLYLQTFIDDYDQKIVADVHLTKTYTFRFFDPKGNLIQTIEVTKYCNDPTAPGNQGDIMKPKP